VYGFSCNGYKIKDDSGTFEKISTRSSFGSYGKLDEQLLRSKCQSANRSCENCFTDSAAPTTSAVPTTSATESDQKARLDQFSTLYGGCFKSGSGSSSEADASKLPYCGSGNLLTPGDARIALSCRYEQSSATKAYTSTYGANTQDGVSLTLSTTHSL
jgi:hypothetical protein